MKAPDLGAKPQVWHHWQINLNRKYQKGNAIYRTGQCDVIIFFNAIHNNKIRQYLQITAITSHYLGGTIMLQITVKCFNFQITVIYCKSIELKTFV